MSIHYNLYENPEQEETGEKKLLHPRVVVSGTYSTEEFIDRVSKYQHIPHAQLVGAVEAIADELKTLLSRGYMVEFGNLGHFYLSLSVNKDVTDKKDVRSPSIRLKNVHLKVKRQYKRELSALMDLERMPSNSDSGKSLSTEECRKLLQDFLDTHPCINRMDYCRMVGVNKTQGIRQLNAFMAEGVIRKYGYGKAVVYIRG